MIHDRPRANARYEHGRVIGGVILRCGQDERTVVVFLVSELLQNVDRLVDGFFKCEFFLVFHRVSFFIALLSRVVVRIR